MKNILVIFTFSLFAVFASFSLYAETEKPLVLVMGEDSYPYQFVDDSGQPQGVLVDLWQEWSRVTAMPVVFVARHWQDSLQQLARGDADIHIGMAKNAARSEHYDFADPIAEISTYLYLRASLAGKYDFADLLPYKIGVVKGSAHASTLRQIDSRFAITEFENRTELLEAVLRQELDIFGSMEGYLRDQSVNRTIVEQFPLNQRLNIDNIDVVPAVLKGRAELIAKIDQGFAAINPARVKQIKKLWLGYSNSSDALVISTTSGIEPFVDVDSEGQPHGMYIDLWKLWSQKTGINISFRVGNMKQTLGDVMQGRSDIHIGYPESESMNTGLTRAHKIYQVKSRLFSYQTPITDLKQLQGKRIGAVPTAPYIDKLREVLPDSQLKLYQGVDQMIEAAKNGHIQAFVASSAWTHHYLISLKVWGDFHQYIPLEFTTDIFALTRKEDSGLTQRVAAGFNLISQRELIDVERKWVLDRNDHTFAAKRSLLSLSKQQQSVIQQAPTLKVGHLNDWQPMEFVDANGEYAGINGEIFAYLEKGLGFKFEPVAFKRWQDLIEALKRGDIDIAGSVAKTPERASSLLFTEPYWPSPWALVTHLDKVSLFSLKELSGQRLAVVEGYHLVNRLMADELDIDLVLVPDTRAGIEAVSEGKADAFVEKVLNMAYELTAKEHNSLKMSVLADFSEQQSHIGVHPRHKALLPLLNVGVASITAEQRQQIYQHWVKPTEVNSGFFNGQWWCGYVILALGTILVCGLILALFIARNRKLAEALGEEQHRRTHIDGLTQLPTRLILDDRLDQAILNHAREMQRFGVLFVSVDSLKRVNQNFGHSTGDRLITMIANDLKDLLRNSDTLARFSHNEFVIVLNRVQDLDKVCQMADGVIRQLNKPYSVDEKTIDVSVSIGVACYPNDGDSAVELLRKADGLMSRARECGGNCYRTA
ncbi:transporter substrate-binding domain-containing protein [Shewanella waksmanii]|uniref:transporter substrate-binding domain-containing protein n=1 Tax=Shewanella waksmanii TaxID=213783 RepID=UPI00048EAA9E|nr:transporter substrate-binding domain-containing protein [Shewanella waksmanii]